MGEINLAQSALAMRVGRVNRIDLGARQLRASALVAIQCFRNARGRFIMRRTSKNNSQLSVF